MSDKVLCVDIDGTLINTDLLLESLLLLIKKNPFHIFLIPVWLLNGKAHMKWQIAKRVNIDSPSLPYNQKFLSFLKSEFEKGRTIVLATASNMKLAKAISEHLNIFHDVIASDDKTNLSGKKKCKALENKYGGKAFDYAGNEKKDFHIWDKANESILVSSNKRFTRWAQQKKEFKEVFSSESRPFFSLIKAIRIHHWVKNFLVFIPLIAAHQINNPVQVFKTFLAFLAFSFSASSVYVLNDLFDLEADRQHPQKQHRPFASGDLSLMMGVMLVPILMIPSIAIGLFLTNKFIIIISLYFLINIFYSLYFKKIVLADIVILAILFTIRIIAGGAATEILISEWFITFSMFLFLSLACIKRLSELQLVRKKKTKSTKGRGYISEDLEQIAMFGSSSGYISVLVFALYINSEKVKSLYSTPWILWLICPLLLYWISRIWLLAHRGEVHSDPIVFAIKDKVSYIVVSLFLLILYLAS